ncbi:phytoene desaturase family protein [Glaciimonas soli]|uniref:NAD(P)-binding protein n=1 Tax=Glaciimonas soli TaxID=2590999 RepID=A0A843YS39_9BURK|nr:NAD(P)/FAD-dependent oxidoreductase [Glaciimonas soli]MQR00062.1 NAD(P)-binding protein [Glaciimonas soli]
MQKETDVIIVGSGMNSLVCAALLARRGKRVLVIERNDELGGCIRSEELFKGYTHDILSSWYPLFVGSPAYAELKSELHSAGLEFVQGDYSTGVVTPDGRSLALRQDLQDTASRLDAICAGDGKTFAAAAERLFGVDAALTFGLLGKNPYGWEMAKLLWNEWRRRGIDGLAEFGTSSLESFRRWGSRDLRSDLARAAIAPWALHTGMGPDDACSGLIAKLTFAAVVANGMPVVKGGSSNLIKAFRTMIERHGGTFLTGTNVDRVLIENRRAVGVFAGGKELQAREAVVCNVTPTQLYGSLLPDAPPEWRERAQAYRYGRGDMQIHFALSSPPDWCDPELAKVPLIHLTENMEAVCMAVTEANNGLIPARPTVAIGQPTAVDPSRAPAGGAILWIQLQEMPSRLNGDALGEIEVPADGRWNEAVREQVADRVQRRMEKVMPGLGEKIVGRRAYSPADLEKLNCNLVGGDPYSGICSPDQFFWLRPFAGSRGKRGHNTPYQSLYQIGASTHPGPGLAGGSGLLVANQLSRA